MKIEIEIDETEFKASCEEHARKLLHSYKMQSILQDMLRNEVRERLEETITKQYVEIGEERILSLYYDAVFRYWRSLNVRDVDRQMRAIVEAAKQHFVEKGSEKQ